MWLIAGLGNPGDKYELTRHNIGFLALDYLAKDASFKASLSSQIASLTINHENCILQKPQNFMNRSGEAIRAALHFYKIDLDHLIVIHDDLDLSLGDIRIKLGGGSGGHNGLKSITNHLGEDYIRLRLGIGRPQNKGLEAQYVLSRFHDHELILLTDLFLLSNKAIETIVHEGLALAQQHCQRKAS